MPTAIRFLLIVFSVILLGPAAGPVYAQCSSAIPSLRSPSSSSCDLPHNDLLPHFISPQAFNDFAPILDALANGPLDSATLQPFATNPAFSENQPVSDPRPLLRKIVSCALPPGATVKFGHTTFPGHLGLCPQWATAHVSGGGPKACQELVSSCVLARVNAVGAEVILSLRSSDPNRILLRDAVAIEEYYRDGTPVRSFDKCSPGAHRDCGFERRFVGRCVGGEQVEITAQKSEHTTIRVCQGLYGCEENRRNVPGAVQPAGWPKQHRGILQFSCPNNGPPRTATERFGYYSVMVKPRGPEPKIKASGSGSYPATEDEVFTYAEGAFYGNFFDVAATRRASYANACGATWTGHQVFLGDQYACYSSGWTSGTAALNQRFCANPGFKCFVNAPMACYAAPHDRCATDALGGSAFSECKATVPAAPVTWHSPLTTYLNNPCDLSGDDQCDPDKVFHPYPPRNKSKQAGGKPDPSYSPDQVAKVTGG